MPPKPRPWMQPDGKLELVARVYKEAGFTRPPHTRVYFVGNPGAGHGALTTEEDAQLRRDFRIPKVFLTGISNRRGGIQPGSFCLILRDVPETIPLTAAITFRGESCPLIQVGMPLKNTSGIEPYVDLITKQVTTFGKPKAKPLYKAQPLVVSPGAAAKMRDNRRRWKHEEREAATEDDDPAESAS